MDIEGSQNKLPEYQNKERIDPPSEAFDELQHLVLDKKPLNDFKHLVCFSHTGTLEIYHVLQQAITKKFVLFIFSYGRCKSVSCCRSQPLRRLELSRRENLSFL